MLSKMNNLCYQFRATLIDMTANELSTSSTRGFASTCPPNQPLRDTTAFVIVSLASVHLSGDGDLDLDTSLDVDDDLLDDLGGGVKAKTSKDRGLAFP